MDIRSALCRATLFLVLFANACSSSSIDNTCSSDIECSAGNSCVDALCVPTDLSCSATNPCPSGQSCCGGTCATTNCCSFDQDCSNGWCNSGVCVDGVRPQCSITTPCDSGICLDIIGRCVECTTSDQCTDGRVCTRANECEVPGSCAQDNNCSVQGLVCDAETGNCRSCTSRIECGDLACLDGSCQACVSGDDCGADRNCVDGRCVNAPGAACTSDANCTDGLICAPNNTCDACQMTTECANDAACIDGRCNATNATCGTDGDCNPPNTICSAGRCTVGCGNASCPQGELCDPLTGRCQVTGVGSSPLGVDCSSHGDCDSGVCYPFEFTSDPSNLTTVCTQACVTTTDCPSNFVCVTLGDGDYCLPNSLIGDRPWNLPPGATCTDGFRSDVCKSGFCDPTTNRCIEKCALDADCASVDDSFVCVYRNVVGTDTNDDDFIAPGEIEGFAALCQPPLFLGAPNLSTCTEGFHDNCASGYCVKTPDQNFQPICAQGCCTPSDCPANRPVCKPIDLWDGLAGQPNDPTGVYGFQRSCLWTEYEGSKGPGELCFEDAECVSEICARGESSAGTGMGRCSHTCCRENDCSGYTWSVGCRTPISNNEDSVDDDQLFDRFFQDIARALGRQFTDGGPTEPASALTTLCIPE